MKRRHTCELFSAVFWPPTGTTSVRPSCGRWGTPGSPVVSGSGGSHQHRPGSFVCGGLLHGRHRRGGSYRYRTADFGSLLLRPHLEADPVRRIPPPGYDRRRGAAVPDRPVRTGVCTATIQPVYWKTAGTGRCELLGHRRISAFTAATRIEGFVNSFGDSGAEAIAIFVAQNTGAGQENRAEKDFLPASG